MAGMVVTQEAADDDIVRWAHYRAVVTEAPFGRNQVKSEGDVLNEDGADDEGTDVKEEHSEDKADIKDEDGSDDDFDLEADGGVKFESVQRGRGERRRPHGPQYQDPVCASERGTLWRFPDAERLTQSPFRPARGIMCLSKSCQKIRQHWGCDAADVLLKECRDSTPYSLALLVTRRSLAFIAKQDRSLAQEMLVQHRKQRLSKFGIRHPATNQTRRFVETKLKGGLEPIITEYVNGITVKDVQAALKGWQARKKALSSEGTGVQRTAGHAAHGRQEEKTKRKKVRD